MPTAIDGRTVRAVANKMSELIIQGNRANYELGALIDRVINEKFWTAWPNQPEGGFKKFDGWCWHVLGRKARWARYLRSNYLNLNAMDVSDSTLARSLRIGWTKLAHILQVTSNEVELLRWIDRVEDESLTEEEIRSEVAILKAPSAVVNPAAIESEISEDEPVDPETGEPLAAIEARAAETGTRTTTRRITYPLTFTDDGDLRIFVKALKTVRQRINPEMGYGEAAALIATNYLGVAARDDEGGLAVELNTLIEAIEHTYNTRLEVAAEQPEARVTARAGDSAMDGF